MSSVKSVEQISKYLTNIESETPSHSFTKIDSEKARVVRDF